MSLEELLKGVGEYRGKAFALQTANSVPVPSNTSSQERSLNTEAGVSQSTARYILKAKQNQKQKGLTKESACYSSQ